MDSGKHKCICIIDSSLKKSLELICETTVHVAEGAGRLF